ncbi:DUF4249 domain-containing protein [Mucilaginibacter sp. PAMB04274]|uniref:DUF4249 domain-containing protein n=1 Tax=Mucilaginibacter sp. PAMB04274 TaxID=3138568 RepID=UPI0031F65EA4
MKLKYYLLLFILCGALLSACQKVIDIDVNTSTSQLVIEGNISNVRENQIIKISRSVAYTEKNVYPAVSGADVRVTDNLGNSWKFAETAPGQYAVIMRGVTGRTYKMKVVVDGQDYAATSVMPTAVKIDSLSLSNVTFGSTTRKLVSVNYTDPKGQPNQYRYIMRINGKKSNRVYVTDDRLTDGNIRKEDLYPDTNDDDEDDDLKTGDQVEVETQNIDKDVFTYWFTLRQQRRGGPGGGVTPGNPPSNISNNALGYFSAHTYYSLAISVP